MSILLRHISRSLSITTNTLSGVRSYYFRRVKEGCECPEPPRDKFETIEEKKCIPCSFATWKPKTRQRLECEIKQDMIKKGPRRCFAGMNTTVPPPDCKFAELDPFKKKCCLGPKSQKRKLLFPEPPEKLIPAADWDIDC